MTRIILLNGPPGVGKTTVGRILAGLFSNGACIHGDDLKHFVVSRVDGAVRDGLGYINGATVAANFVEAGYECVVFEFVFEQPSQVDRFVSAFRLPFPIHLFTLWAPLEMVLARERSRQNREPLGERVAACYEAMAQNLDRLGTRIEIGAMPPEAVARMIRRLVEDQDTGLLRR